MGPTKISFRAISPPLSIAPPSPLDEEQLDAQSIWKELESVRNEAQPTPSKLTKIQLQENRSYTLTNPPENGFWRACCKTDLIVDLTNKQTDTPHFPTESDQTIQRDGMDISCKEVTHVKAKDTSEYTLSFKDPFDDEDLLVRRVHHTGWRFPKEVALPNLGYLLDIIENSQPKKPPFIFGDEKRGRPGTLITAESIREAIKSGELNSRPALRKHLIKIAKKGYETYGKDFISSPRQIAILLQFGVQELEGVDKVPSLSYFISTTPYTPSKTGSSFESRPASPADEPSKPSFEIQNRFIYDGEALERKIRTARSFIKDVKNPEEEREAAAKDIENILKEQKKNKDLLNAAEERLALSPRGYWIAWKLPNNSTIIAQNPPEGIFDHKIDLSVIRPTAHPKDELERLLDSDYEYPKLIKRGYAVSDETDAIQCLEDKPVGSWVIYETGSYKWDILQKSPEGDIIKHPIEFELKEDLSLLFNPEDDLFRKIGKKLSSDNLFNILKDKKRTARSPESAQRKLNKDPKCPWIISRKEDQLYFLSQKNAEPQKLTVNNEINLFTAIGNLLKEEGREHPETKFSSAKTSEGLDLDSKKMDATQLLRVEHPFE